MSFYHFVQFLYLNSVSLITVVKRIICHDSPIMEVCGQNKRLTKDPVDDGGDLRLAPEHHLLLGHAQVVPGGEGSVQVNRVSVVASWAHVMTSAYSYSKRNYLNSTQRCIWSKDMNKEMNLFLNFSRQTVGLNIIRLLWNEKVTKTYSIQGS